MKNYYTQTLSFVLFLLCAAGVARAQHVWQNSLPQPAAAAGCGRLFCQMCWARATPAAQSRKSTKDRVWV